MSRQVLYVAAPLRPTEAEISDMQRYRDRSEMAFFSAEDTKRALRANLDRAMRWLAWLRKSFPETTFIAPWIASVLAGADDTDPTQREAGMADACAVIERCDGIVLCGGRISDGMRREMEHGRRAHSRAEAYTEDFEVYDLTSYEIQGASGRNEDRRTFEQWMLGYRESCTR